jgi:SAM-dependent methyltransferase
MDLRNVESANKQAWDRLYGSTEDLVWGGKPIGFLLEFLPQLESALGEDSLILDAATGEGRNLRALMTLSRNVFACDASPEALIKAGVSLQSEVPLCRCDLTRIAFKNDVLDLALVSDVIETLPDPASVLREIRRILKPGGLLLCNIPDLDDEISHEKMIPFDRDSFLFDNTYFFRFYSFDQAFHLLTENGFSVIRNKKCHWREDAHPKYRSHAHEHTSQVFLARKPA